MPVLPRDSYLTSVQTNAKKEAETTGSVKGVALANEVKEFFDGVDDIVTGDEAAKQSAKTDMFNLYQDYKSKDTTSVPPDNPSRQQTFPSHPRSRWMFRW